MTKTKTKAVPPPPADAEGVKILSYLPCAQGPLFVREGDQLVRRTDFSILKPTVPHKGFIIASATVPYPIFAPILLWIGRKPAIWFLWCLLYSLVASFGFWSIAAAMGTNLLAAVYMKKVPAEEAGEDAVSAENAKVVDESGKDVSTHETTVTSIEPETCSV